MSPKGTPFAAGNAYAFAKGENGRTRVSPRFVKIRNDLASKYGGYDALDPATAQIIDSAALAKYSAERKPAERSTYLGVFVRCLSLLEPPEQRRLHRRIGGGLGPQKSPPTPSLQQILDDARKSIAEAS
jgi:hypothetical protein